MRISDWSSDVCSSYLCLTVWQYSFNRLDEQGGTPTQLGSDVLCPRNMSSGPFLCPPSPSSRWDRPPPFWRNASSRLPPVTMPTSATAARQIGRASCRERVCQYV